MFKNIITVIFLCGICFSVSCSDNEGKESQFPHPVNIRVTEYTESALTFAWDAVPNAKGYNYLLEAVSTGKTIASAYTASTTASFTGLTCGTQYRFSVQTVPDNPDYKSLFSDPIMATPGFSNGLYGRTPDIVVSLDGSGDFTKIQDAINSVASRKAEPTVILIKNGTYNSEKLIVPSDKNNIIMRGESRTGTIISYHIYDCTSPSSENKCPAEAWELWKDNAALISTSATLTVEGDGFIACDLTIRNSAGPVGQALAITVNGDKGIYVNCDLLGYQDTVYLRASAKRSYFHNCLVLGRTDYIYGGGIGYFEGCEIRSYGGGWITAPSTAREQHYGFVFHNCDVTYATGSPKSGDDGQLVALGRPWHNYPKVSWLDCHMCAEINPLGWPTTWNMDYAATSADLHLYEFNNRGPGAAFEGRAEWVGIKMLTDVQAEAYTAKAVMAGTDGWNPLNTLKELKL